VDPAHGGIPVAPYHGNSQIQTWMDVTPTVSEPKSTDPLDDPTATPQETTGLWGTVRAFLKRRKRWIIAGLAIAVVVSIAVPVMRVLIAWNRVERVEFDPDEARIAISDQLLAADAIPPTTLGGVPTGDPASLTTIAVEPPAEIPLSETRGDDGHTAILIIGSDAGGHRADVIILALLPSDGSAPALVSLPRDLYLDDPCGGGRERINASLNGCGAVTGPNLLAITVEDFTGVPVDYFVLFDFDGFARVIDAAGGVEICVDNYTFDSKTDPELALLAGCNVVDGRMALSWVRSRHTREIVDGVERSMPGVNDLTRNARQREIVLQLMSRLSSFPNPAELVALVEAVPGAFTLSDDLSLGAAIGIAWDLRGIPIKSVATPEIPVTFYTTSTGASVLLPVESFAETMGWSAG
jgi:LCP family protein required for cell wall assembly